MNNKKIFQQHGFSLIELLVVMVIVVILSLILLPTLTFFLRNIKLKTASENLKGVLTYTQRLAITHNHLYTCYIEYSSTGCRAGIYPLNNASDSPNSDELVGKEYVFPANVGIAQVHTSAGDTEWSPIQITYHPRGSLVDPSTAYYIHIIHQNDTVDCANTETRLNAYTVKVIPLTGLVKSYPRGVCCGLSDHWQDET